MAMHPAVNHTLPVVRGVQQCVVTEVDKIETSFASTQNTGREGLRVNVAPCWCDAWQRPPKKVGSPGHTAKTIQFC